MLAGSQLEHSIPHMCGNVAHERALCADDYLTAPDCCLQSPKTPAGASRYAASEKSKLFYGSISSSLSPRVAIVRNSNFLL